MKKSLVFFLLSSCLADMQIVGKSSVANYVCRVMLSSTVIQVVPDKAGFQNFCNPENYLTLGSISHCLIDNFNNNLAYNDDFLHFCKGNISHEEFYNGYTAAIPYITDPPAGSDWLASSPLLPPGVYSFPVFYTYPIRFKQQDVLQQFNSNWNAFNQTNWSIWFGLTLVLYWFAIMLVAALNHWGYWIIPLVVKKLHGPVINWFRRTFILAPLFRKRHAKTKSFAGYIPLRFETLGILGFILLCIFFLIFQNHQRAPDIVAFTAGLRTGVLVIFTLPLLILFPGRNNFMQWLTGWPYSRFLVFHRWIGRIVFVLLIVHAILMTIALKGFHLYNYWFHEAWLRWGAVGIASVTLIVITSFQIFRQFYYEIFVIIHIILVAFFIAGGWIHAKPRGDMYLYPFYAAIAVWGFDRVIRFIRLLTFGIQKATIQVINNDTLKIVSNRPKWWIPHPGAHAFVHFWKLNCFWQSHPFTLVDSVVEPNTVSFYIKVKDGITKQLKREIEAKSNSQGQYRIIVEGPYSQKLPLHKFENVVFFAGGNGVPGLYHEALKLIRNKQTSASTKHVKFYWVIRNFNYINWFYSELLQFENSIVRPIIYVTQPEITIEKFNTSKHEKNSDSSDLDTPESLVSKVSLYDIKQHLSFIEFREGRPNVQPIVEEEVELANGAVAISVCAPEAMVDDTRLAVRNVLSKETSKRIDYFEEIQGW